MLDFGPHFVPFRQNLRIKGPKTCLLAIFPWLAEKKSRNEWNASHLANKLQGRSKKKLTCHSNWVKNESFWSKWFLFSFTISIDVKFREKYTFFPVLQWRNCLQFFTRSFIRSMVQNVLHRAGHHYHALFCTNNMFSHLKNRDNFSCCNKLTVKLYRKKLIYFLGG